MPQIKFAKTENIENLKDKEKVEDKLYIIKQTNNRGKIYYDFDNETRIEIESDTYVYLTDYALPSETTSISTNIIHRFINNEKQDVTAKDIKINELIMDYTSSNIYTIIDIDLDNNVLQIKKLFTQHPLKWNDYY